MAVKMTGIDGSHSTAMLTGPASELNEPLPNTMTCGTQLPPPSPLSPLFLWNKELSTQNHCLTTAVHINRDLVQLSVHANVVESGHHR